jgi:L-arabinonolactonase
MKIFPVDTRRYALGEGPVWDVAQQALYTVDGVDNLIARYTPRSGETRTWPTPRKVCALALRADGGAILSMADGVYSFDFETGACAAFALPDPIDARIKFNDSKVDRRGRFIVGSNDSQLKTHIGKIYRVDGPNALVEIDTGICASNGPCWSPDDRLFYFADSMTNTIFVYDYDIETGSIANKRPFASTEELGGIPDGATVDADGMVWSAICKAGRIACFRPDGRLERLIEMPVRLTSSVAFGGAELDQLFVTSIEATATGRPPEPESGHLFVIEGLGTKGLPQPRCRI